MKKSTEAWRIMGKRQECDPLIPELERALAPGHFITYRQSREFVRELESVKSCLDALVDKGEAERSVRLYELFLAGFYEKAEEIDDSGGDFGMFFEEVFVAWIKARQKAGAIAQETVRQALNWMEHDHYGFCCNIEKEVARALDNEGFTLFKGHFETQFESAFAPFNREQPRFIYDYPREVIGTVRILKNIYIAKNDVRSYRTLCEKISPSPQDCENIANLYKGKRRYDEALLWVEKGLALEPQRQWGNQSSHALRYMREELLGKVGRKEAAFESAWSQFQHYPSSHGYDNLMKYVTGDDARRWHETALQTAKAASLSAFIEICTQAKEWDLLAGHIESLARKELDAISHFVTEKAAKGLARRHAAAAAKIYCALGMRVLKSGKSKYYPNALADFREAQRLAAKAHANDLWQEVIREVRENHSRKYGFLADFEQLAAGMPCKPPESFEERARKRWKKQASQ